MSLKSFHLVFIIAGIFILLMFPAWVFYIEPQAGKDYVGMGVGSLIVAGVLIVYGLWFFLKKSSTIIV